MRIPQKDDIYRHFKGNKYIIVDIAENCTNDINDERNYVVYKRLLDDKLFIRTLSEFTSEVDHEKYPDVKQKYRFQYICNTNDD